MTSAQKNTDWLGTIIRALIFTVLLWFIIFVIVFPNIDTMTFVFFQDGQFTMTAFERFWAAPAARAALRNSFILAPILTITVGFVGVSLVLITEYFKIKGAKILRMGYMTSLFYSGVVLVSGYRFVYAEGGFLPTFLYNTFGMDISNWQFEGFWPVLFVMTFAATGNHLLFLRNAMRSIDYQTVEAAQNMGAKPLFILWKVVLPVLTPSLLAVSIFTFLGGAGAVAAPLMIGGADFQTITPTVLTLSRMQGSRDIAALLAIFLGMATIILVSFLSWLESRGHYLSVSKTKTTLVKQKINNPVFNVLAHAYAYLLFAIYMAPVVLITLFSFTNASAIARRQFTLADLTLENYIHVFSGNQISGQSTSSFQPILTSIVLSVVAAAIVAVFVTFVCRVITKSKGKGWFGKLFSNVLEYGLMIPWLLPSVLIALGLGMTFRDPQWFMGNQVLLGTIGILLLGYMIIRIPFTLRMTRAAFFAVDDTLEEAAKNLGSGPLRTFMKIILPVLIPSIMAIFALNVNFLLTEFELSVFLFTPTSVPLGVAIRNLLQEASGGVDNTSLTLVYAVFTMIASALMIYVAYGRKQMRED